MIYMVWFISAALVLISLITILNTLTFPRLSRYLNNGRENPPSGSASSARLPFVSILIPARNEAPRIGKTIASLLAQDHVPFELIVLDDNSTDGTAEIAHEAACGDARLKVIQGEPLPAGWLGKTWACHQLAQIASGDLLIFTDADVLWQPSALRALLHLFNRSEADMLTIWPTQYTETWGERLVVPLMALTIIGYLPILAVHYIPWSVFAAANGQCLVFRRSVYQHLGGHASVRNKIVEDIILAKQVKRHRFRLRMAEGDHLISCRMYTSWQEVRDGYAKNILAGHGGSVSFLTLSALFHWSVFLLPWLWLVVGFWFPKFPKGLASAYPVLPLSWIILGVGIRALSAAVTHQRLWDAWLLPISTLLMTRIAWQSILWHWRYGGPLWKGRVVSR